MILRIHHATSTSPNPHNVLMRLYLFYLCASTTWISTAGQIQSVAPSQSPQPSVSWVPTTSNSSTNLPSRSASPSMVPSIAPSFSPTFTVAPSVPPSQPPTDLPTTTNPPSFLPSSTRGPSELPSPLPTGLPSWSPSHLPSTKPSWSPTIFPTRSSQPSSRPSIAPTISFQPSDYPTNIPSTSLEPSHQPSMAPSVSRQPSSQPSVSAMPTLSLMPSLQPSLHPSFMPSISSRPSAAPSRSPAPSASFGPSDQPSDMPSQFPSNLPTITPFPSPAPSEYPSALPSTTPSKAPSTVPSAAPTFTPAVESRLVGIVITGLDRQRTIRGFERSFEALVDNHTLEFWSPSMATNWATVVYNSSTIFKSVLRGPSPFWRPLQQEFWGITTPPTAAPVGVVPTGTRQLRQATSGDLPREATTKEPSSIRRRLQSEADNNVESTLSSQPSGNGSGYVYIVINVTSANQTNMPSAYSTVSHVPTVEASTTPTISPTTTAAPSLSPSASFAPSRVPTSLPQTSTHQIWYEQTIVYGEQFLSYNDTPGANNDPRTTTLDQIFQFPFILDQTSFAERLVELINNQLPLTVEFVEVREIGVSNAPTQYVSTFPSATPTIVPSTAPSSLPPAQTVGTSAIIVAVTVPVVVVLIIAFGGIIFVTRVDQEELLRSHQDDSITFDDLPPPPAPVPIDPAAAPGQGDVGAGGLGAAATGALGGGSAAGLGVDEVTFGAPVPEPLIDASELLEVSQQQQQQQQDPPPLRRMSSEGFHAYMSSEPQTTPTGYLPPSDTFVPIIASMPDLPPTPLRVGIPRASTTGELPSSFTSVTSTGRISPFYAVPGGAIPTIPTFQLGSSEVSSTSFGSILAVAPPAGGGDVSDPNVSVLDSSQLEGSDLEEENDDPFAMTAFNLQVMDIDDLGDLDDLDDLQ